MQCAIFDSFGSPSQVIRLVDRDPRPPAANQVRIRLEASPINPADMLLITGQHATQPTFPAVAGIEGVGIVVELGSEVTDLSLGDRVLLPPGGTWSEETTVAAAAVYPVPADMDVLQAAMLSVNPVAAACLLSSHQSLQAGDWVLQNAANSALGKLLIRIAAAQGIKTVNIVRRADAVEELRALGADVVLVGEEDLPERIRAATGGASLRLALDAIAGCSAGRLLDCLANGGTLVTYGLLSGEPLQLPAARVVFGDLTITGFSRARALHQMGSVQARRFILDLAALVMNGQLATEIEAVYPFSRIHDALAHAERETRGGKIVITFE